MDPVRAIADAVLYEGYILWPYRSCALKNQRRWTFGGVYPPAHSAEHPDDRCVVRADCLVEGDGEVDVTARFLHVVERRAGAGTGYVDWDEAVEREAGPGPIAVAAGEGVEEVEGGSVVRRWEGLEGELRCTREPGRVSVELINTTPWGGGARDEVLRRTFCSAHVVLRARGCAFVSQQDPPEHLRAATAALRSEGLWPVLVGEPGSRDTVLASPFILEDHPRIAPESPGDLFDGGEIDQMLVLNILALTDSEKEQMRATDPRAREILDRTEGLTGEEIMRLHGALRELGALR
jgi:hydrogenase maturation protease